MPVMMAGRGAPQVMGSKIIYPQGLQVKPQGMVYWPPG